MYGNETPGRRFVAAALLGIGLAAAVALSACGDDDDNGDDPTETATPVETGDSGSPDASGETEDASATAVVELPAICTEEHNQTGLLSRTIVVGEDGIFMPGEEVTATLLLANCGDNETRLYYVDGQRYVFIIEDEDKNEIWRSDDGESFEQASGQEVLNPGDTAEYTATWDQLTRDGAQVPPGIYRFSGFSVACGTESQDQCRFGGVRLFEVREQTPEPTATPGETATPAETAAP